MLHTDSASNARVANTTWLRRNARMVKRRVKAGTPAPVAAALERADYWRRLFASRNPTSFNDKIFYKMLRDHRPLVTTFADKDAVRGYVANAVGADLLPEVYTITDTPSELLGLGLPEQFALKATHASGGVIIVSDTAPTEARLPHENTYWPRVALRPEHVDWDQLVRVCTAWLGREYGGGRFREWAYTNVPHRILVEELLRDERGEIPVDYKLFVFNGRCRLVQVDSSRYGEHRQNFFDREWSPLPVELAAPPADPAPEPPPSLARMVEVAERLGVDTDFVRVDLYDVDGRLVFGEMTSYVLGGSFRFRPPEFEIEIGSWWTVPRRYL